MPQGEEKIDVIGRDRLLRQPCRRWPARRHQCDPTRLDPGMPFGLPGVGIWSMDASYSTLSLLLSSRSEEVSPAAVPSRMPPRTRATRDRAVLLIVSPASLIRVNRS